MTIRRCQVSRADLEASADNAEDDDGTRLDPAAVAGPALGPEGTRARDEEGGAEARDWSSLGVPERRRAEGMQLALALCRGTCHLSSRQCHLATL